MMGFFEDNHFAGEAHNFGTGYMARAGHYPLAGLSDDGHPGSEGSEEDKVHGSSPSHYYESMCDPRMWKPPTAFDTRHRGSRVAQDMKGDNGKFYMGTRKCSVCEGYKMKDDFTAAEADESSARRCCQKCRHDIMVAIQSIERNPPTTNTAETNIGSSTVTPPPASSVEVGRTHKVFGPDKSSIGMQPSALPHDCLPPSNTY